MTLDEALARVAAYYDAPAAATRTGEEARWASVCRDVRHGLDPAEWPALAVRLGCEVRQGGNDSLICVADGRKQPSVLHAIEVAIRAERWRRLESLNQGVIG